MDDGEVSRHGSIPAASSLAHLALRSEIALFPTAAPLADSNQTGKALLAFEGMPGPSTASASSLHLHPLTSEADWHFYTRQRVLIEAEFDVSPRQAREMVDRLRSRTRRLGQRMYLAAIDQACVGAIGYFVVTTGDRQAARLQEIDIFPTHRGQGHGNAMLSKLTSELTAEGAAVIVGADEDDWPLSWYRRHGFVLVQRVHLSR